MPWSAAPTALDVNRLTINVGSGTEVSVRELARLATEVTGGHPEIVYNPRNEGGLSRLCADLTLAREKLGYEPKTSLLEGLKTTLEREIMPELKARTSPKDATAPFLFKAHLGLGIIHLCPACRSIFINEK